MTKEETIKLTDDILALPKDVRAYLVQKLIESLVGEEEFAADIEAEWRAEIARRSKMIDEGKAQLRPISECYADIRKAIDAVRTARSRGEQ